MSNKEESKNENKNPPKLSNIIFSINNILSIIKKYLTLDDEKSFFSCNKFLNEYFRNSITKLSPKKIISNPDIIKRYQNIKEIKFDFGWETDLIFLKDLKKLESLELSGAKYENIETIGVFENLTKLVLIGNNLRDINFISNLKKLNFLDIGNNLISDLKPLLNMNNLISLSLQGCGIDNLSILNFPIFQRLEKLYIGQNVITDFSFLKNLQNLKVLNIYQIPNLKSIYFLN